MDTLIESLRVENGKLCDIKYHNYRINRSRHELFRNSSTSPSCSSPGRMSWKILKNMVRNIQREIRLEDEINIPEEFRTGRVKCRVIYGPDIEKIEFAKYKIRNITSLKLVYTDDIDYSYKFTDRSSIGMLLNERGNFYISI